MTGALWTWADLVAAARGTVEAGPAPLPGEVAGFSIDTRSIQPGEVFVALRDVRDGHDFVGAAFKAGAAAALVRGHYARQAGDGVLLWVDDPLAALVRIAGAARARLPDEARVVAVTGSAGKTTTKEMLRACFEAVAPGRVHASLKSYNNHWGVPLMLANMPAETRYGVFEIGMNHAGEITPLTQMVRPHVAVVVNVLPVHVGNFPDGEVGVANAKAEIFAGLAPGGVAVLPADSRHTALLREAATRAGADVKTFAFGGEARADYRIPAAPAGQAGERSRYSVVRRDDAPLPLTLGVPGDHNAADALAVLLAVAACGADVVRASGALAAFGAPAGRGDRSLLTVGDGQALLVDESYNANPASMAAALEAAGQIADTRFGRRVAVLGEMLELGAQSADYHVGLKGVVERTADVVFACGPNMKRLFEALPEGLRGAWAETAVGLEPMVLAAIRPGDVVMVKGSNGARAWAIVAAIKKRFASTVGGR